MIDGEAKRVNRQNDAPEFDDTSWDNSRDQSLRTETQPSESINAKVSRRDIGIAAASAVLPEWLNMITMMTLIFGGCCSNVFTLEAIVKEAPGSGTLITCFQFLITFLLTWPRHFDFSRGIKNLYLKPRAIPFTQWLAFTAFFLTINVLNNKAFNYKISVPLHIILRSAGPVSTMIVGYFAGRRYSKMQVVAVLMLFTGVVQAAISDAQSKGTNIQLAASEQRSTSEFLTGFSMLFLALVLSAFLGVFSDRMYAKYGREHTEENLFYSHTLSLPFFLTRLPALQSQTMALFTSPSSTVFISQRAGGQLSSLLHDLMSLVPVQVLFVIMNGLTQYLCIRGVNQLSARSSSLTVGIVLNIRKLVSLLLSIWLFGNQLGPGVLTGAAIVFVGGALYALPSGKRMQSTKTKTSSLKKEL